MSGWLGLVLLGAAGVLALRSHGRWKRARTEGTAPPPTHEALAGLADSLPPMIYAALALAGLGITAGFVISGGGGFSMLDLGGVLALLGGFGADIGTRVHCRPRGGL